jgi:hypothetical protein
MITEALSAGLAAEGTASAVLVVFIVQRIRRRGVRLPQTRAVTAPVTVRAIVLHRPAITPAPDRDARPE